MDSPEIWLSTLELAFNAGARNMNNRKGCWERTVGPWWVALNGHGQPVRCSHGGLVDALNVYVEYQGMAAGMVGPAGGEIVFSDDANEDALLAALEAETLLLKTRDLATGAA